MTESDLFFVEVRTGTSQWSVRLHEAQGKEVALVTERVIAKPPYIVRFFDEKGSLGPDFYCDDRDEVITTIFKRLS